MARPGMGYSWSVTAGNPPLRPCTPGVHNGDMATTTAARQYATVDDAIEDVAGLLDLARAHGAEGQHTFDVVRRALHTSENRCRAADRLTSEAAADYAAARAALRRIEREQTPEHHVCSACGAVTSAQTPAERLAGLRTCLDAAADRL